METTTETAADEIAKVCRDGDISETVVTAVAEAKDVDPLDLKPLYDVVDPDALNRIFSPSIGTPDAMEFRFSMDGCGVVVHGDGEVVVTPPTSSDETSASFTAQE